MVDCFSKKRRSRLMSLVKSEGNLATEIALLKIMKSNKITGWRRNIKLLGKPDFVFPKNKAAVFVDGCFWHGCLLHRKRPSSNKRFWNKKLDQNIKRDRFVARKLKASGWKVVRIWQHDLKNVDWVTNTLRKNLQIR